LVAVAVARMDKVDLLHGRGLQNPVVTTGQTMTVAEELRPQVAPLE
jgi:hypothetical protein